ncbi:Protein zer-1 [Penaeus vannamei]|uniref:Protein zer-1 n=1 Tax=Penaeus vannamei TaxID=6689 RepID=A0A423UBI2_PENVA|nr:Protein zer-1 [Penaeus vannamei]
MWNVTDETPVNCQRFLDGHGMTYFQKCLREFPDKPELLRNMMGLLGNVAEVKELRCRLMTSDLLTTFADLLDSNSDGIEVSYNAAGVLSHIASDGVEAWTIDHPTRNEVLERMVAAIERWDLASKRNINYRSFQPILRLLEVYHTPQCQHWAAWALANLTRVYPDKYCSLVEEEGGIQLLEVLLKSSIPYMRIQNLAKIVITHDYFNPLLFPPFIKDFGSLERMDLDSDS